MTEFPESKSDMPLIPLGLGFEIKRKKYMSCTKISRYQQLNAWRIKKLPHVQETFSII